MPHQPFPGQITSLVAQERVRKHLGARVNVFIEGRFSFALDMELVLQRGLSAAMVIDKPLLEELLRLDGDARAYARALHFFGYRMRTQREIQERLERDEWPQPVIDRVLTRLVSEGLINDERFAAGWVESRSLSKPRGARALQWELSRKGISRETIREALPDADQEIENAIEAARRKYHEWSTLDERMRREKLLAFLQRRGFNFSTAKAALARLEEED